MKKILSIIVGFVILFVLLPSISLVSKATNWDGIYKVSGYKQTCEPPIDLQSGFTVSSNKMVNLYGTDGNIASDGTGTMRMNYGNKEYVSLAYRFTSSGSSLKATVNWTSSSHGSSRTCSGSFTASASSLFSFFSFPDLSDPTGTTGIIVAVVVFVVIFVGLLFFVMIFSAVFRGGKPPTPEKPEEEPAQEPMDTTPAQSQPAVQNDQGKSEVVNKPTNKVPAKKGARQKRPVYGKLRPQKKGHVIWPELTKRTPPKH